MTLVDRSGPGSQRLVTRIWTPGPVLQDPTVCLADLCFLVTHGPASKNSRRALGVLVLWDELEAPYAQRRGADALMGALGACRLRN